MHTKSVLLHSLIDLPTFLLVGFIVYCVCVRSSSRPYPFLIYLLDIRLFSFWLTRMLLVWLKLMIICESILCWHYLASTISMGNIIKVWLLIECSQHCLTNNTHLLNCCALGFFPNSPILAPQGIFLVRKPLELCHSSVPTCLVGKSTCLGLSVWSINLPVCPFIRCMATCSKPSSPKLCARFSLCIEFSHRAYYQPHRIPPVNCWFKPNVNGSSFTNNGWKATVVLHSIQTIWCIPLWCIQSTGAKPSNFN